MTARALVPIALIVLLAVAGAVGFVLSGGIDGPPIDPGEWIR